MRLQQRYKMHIYQKLYSCIVCCSCNSNKITINPNVIVFNHLCLGRFWRWFSITMACCQFLLKVHVATTLLLTFLYLQQLSTLNSSRHVPCLLPWNLLIDLYEVSRCLHSVRLNVIMQYLMTYTATQSTNTILATSSQEVIVENINLLEDTTTCFTVWLLIWPGLCWDGRLKSRKWYPINSFPSTLQVSKFH